MEHGKFSISKIWHIAKMEYIKLIMDPRMILIVAALVFAYQFITVPLLLNAAMMGKPINVYAEGGKRKLVFRTDFVRTDEYS